jgi:histidine ammonia-lyase
VAGNAEHALSIELLAGAQAVEFLAPLEPGGGGRAAHAFVRSVSPAVVEDRPLSSDIQRIAETIRRGELVAAVERDIGELR